jgi:hypothetical protein
LLPYLCRIDAQASPKSNLPTPVSAPGSRSCAG